MPSNDVVAKIPLCDLDLLVDGQRAWRQQFNLQRSIFQHAYANYWKSVIDKCPDSRSLWRTVGVLLEPEVHSVSVHSASAFSTFFRRQSEFNKGYNWTSSGAQDNQA